MTNNEMKNAYRRSLTHTEKTIISMEECSELSKAVSKIYRKGVTKETLDNLVEEMADVTLVLDWLKDMYPITQNDVNKWVEYKIKRNYERAIGRIEE